MDRHRAAWLLERILSSALTVVSVPSVLYHMSHFTGLLASDRAARARERERGRERKRMRERRLRYNEAWEVGG
jgi:hypothetical protein